MLNTSKAVIGILLCALSTPLAANSIYLVRHAEKQQDGADPALTECGKERAQALAALLSEIKLSAVYATPYQRTQQTAAAVAKQQQLSVSLYDPREPALLTEQLAQADGPVLVVGHSNTVPALVTLLSSIEVAPLNEQQFDMIYQVDTKKSSVSIVRQAFQCTAQ